MPYPPLARLAALARQFRRFRLWIALSLALGTTAAALAATEPLFYRALLDLLVRARLHPGARAGWIGFELLAGLAALLLAQRLLQTAQSLSVNRVRFDSSFDLAARTLHQLYAQPLGFHQQSGAGYIMARVDRGIAASGQLVSELLQSLLPNTVNLLLMMALLYRLSPRLAWVGLAPMPLFLWATLRAASLQAGHEEAVQEGWSRLYSRVTEVLAGIKTVKSLGGEAAEVEAYRRQARLIFHRLWKLVWVEVGYGEIRGALDLCGRLGVAGYGFWLVLQGQITPGTWIAATTFATLLYGPLAGLAGTCTSVARGLVAAGAVLDFLAAEPPAAFAAAGVAPAPPLPALRGEVAFEAVSYAYPAADAAAALRPRLALDAVSFSIAAGETVALIGPSGGGKTTLTDLLLRFHHPDTGRITLDGHDLAAIAPADLRRQVAVVLQEPLLLQGTVEENLLYACPGATAAQVRAAVRAAQAEGFVARLPHGLGTRLGEQGVRLSGGEKQRLAIARALLRDPRILILDEATAHLDAASEAALHAALEELVRDRTAIVISHRLASLLPCDRILVIADGRLQEQGTPAALRQSGGFYARHAPAPLAAAG